MKYAKSFIFKCFDKKTDLSSTQIDHVPNMIFSLSYTDCGQEKPGQRPFKTLRVL